MPIVITKCCFDIALASSERDSVWPPAGPSHGRSKSQSSLVCIVVVYHNTHGSLCKLFESSSVDVDQISELPQRGAHGRVSHVFHSGSPAAELAPEAMVEERKSVRVLIVLNTVHPFPNIEVAFSVIPPDIKE